jgi:cellulose synthase/poly-beta-1,6-N-acetylglucosamine synthase-like glycosyltransferase
MLLSIICVTTLISFFYIKLVCKFTKGWKQTPFFLAEDRLSSAKNISVIIAFRNEAENLPKLIAALKKQSVTDFQVIFIDDHSTDASKTIIESSILNFENWTLVSANQQGKKKALKEAINLAKGELIITTDADCIPQLKWIATINEFQNKNQCDLIICPVKMNARHTLFTKLQSLEFTTLVASGAGAAGANMPIMCNGANLAFTKKAWLESVDELHEEELSGDDMFLLQSIKKRNGKITFLKSETAIVSTKAVDKFGAFIKQRQRWTSKSKLYSDFDTIYTALIVFSITILQVLLLIAALINIDYLILFATLFSLKLMVDIHLILKVKNFFKIKNIVLNSFLLSLIYPLYITFTAISGLLIKTKKW